VPRALVLGSFDVLHYGHLRFLNQAARLGDVIVGLGTDSYQESYKRKPVQAYWEREAALNELPMVSAVVPRDNVNVESLIEEHSPTYLVAGSDWIGNPFLELSGIDVAYLEANNIVLVYLPRGHDMSTTEILRRASA
jgi:cytidyltransferase-like protein